MKKLLAFLITVSLILSFACLPAMAEENAPAEPAEVTLNDASGPAPEVNDETSDGEVYEDVFADWNPDAPALTDCWQHL